jgi:ATP-dependent RNA helicase RhlB
MTVLKALKKMFGKAEGEQPSPTSTSASPTTPHSGDTHHQQSSRPAKPQTAASDTDSEPAVAVNPEKLTVKTDKPRRQRAAKPVDTWKLEDFAVEPAEGKTRFHDFKLSPELMHAVHDLGFPYCTPIQAQVLGFTLKGQDAIGRAQTGTGKTAAFLVSIITSSSRPHRRKSATWASRAR